MSRTYLSLLLAGSSLALGGCVASMAASAAGMAARSARGESESNEHLTPMAEKACSSRASQYGTVRIIDVEQRTVSKIIVWGTVGEGEGRRSFRCTYGTKISDFQLRTVTSGR